MFLVKLCTLDRIRYLATKTQDDVVKTLGQEESNNDDSEDRIPQRIMELGCQLGCGDFVSELVHVQEGDILSFTVRVSPNPRYNVRKLEDMCQAVQFLPKPRGPGPGPGPQAKEPLIFLPPDHAGSIMRRWPNPMSLIPAQQFTLTVPTGHAALEEKYSNTKAKQDHATIKENLATRDNGKEEDTEFDEDGNTSDGSSELSEHEYWHA
jgi:hypothetical protein